MEVFWSWQNDVTPNANRHFIRDALANAVEQVGDELGLEDAERPELDHDTKKTPGMAEITATILRKISKSAVFVADLTPIAKTSDGKALSNPNVLITAHGYGPDDLPFDIRHRRTLTYELPTDTGKQARNAAKKGFVSNLTEALRTNLGHYVEDQATVSQIVCVDAKHEDRSIWATASDEVEHFDMRHRPASCALPSCPRGYIRIIPAGWKNHIPPVSAVAGAPPQETVQPVAEGTRSGDFGPCEQGYVRYWHTCTTSAGKLETRNVAMWFDETGEFWVLHGTAIDEWKPGQRHLNVRSLIRGWHQNLRAAIAFFDRQEALAVRKVEVGLVGIQGVLWPTRPDPIRARKGQCFHIRQLRSWTESAQLDFLTDVYNRIRDAFGLPHAATEDLREMLEQQQVCPGNRRPCSLNTVLE